MLRPFRWKVLEYCDIVYVKERVKCISEFQHCRFSQDQGRRERNGGSVGQLSSFISHACRYVATLRFFSPPGTLRSDLPTQKRYSCRHVGSITRCIVSNHHAVGVAHSQALQYNMLAQNCYSSWFDISVWHFVFFFFSPLVGRMQWKMGSFSRRPRSLVRSPQPWGVSLSGLQMIHM